MKVPTLVSQRCGWGFSLIASDAVSFAKRLPTFRINLVPPSLGFSST